MEKAPGLEVSAADGWSFPLTSLRAGVYVHHTWLFWTWVATWLLLYIVLRDVVRRGCDVWGRNLSTKLKDDLKIGGGSYVLSTCHSALLVFRGYAHLIDFWSAPRQVQVQPPLDPLMPFHAETLKVVVSNTIFSAYLCSDLFIMVAHWPKLGGIDMLLHHLGFLAVAACGTSNFCMPFQFAWLILGEVSTIFLNTRWFVIKTGKGHTKLMLANNFLFSTTFFLARVVMYAAGVFDLIYSVTYITRPTVAGRWLILGGIGAGLILNLMWFVKIIKIATASKPKTQ